MSNLKAAILMSHVLEAHGCLSPCSLASLLLWRRRGLLGLWGAETGTGTPSTERRTLNNIPPPECTSFWSIVGSDLAVLGCWSALGEYRSTYLDLTVVWSTPEIGERSRHWMSLLCVQPRE